MMKLFLLLLAAFGVVHAAMRGERHPGTYSDVDRIPIRDLKRTFGFPNLAAAEKAVEKAEEAIAKKKAKGRTTSRNHKENKSSKAPTLTVSPSSPPGVIDSTVPSTEKNAKGGKENKVDKSNKEPSSSSSPSAPPDIGNSMAPSTDGATKNGKDSKVGKSNKAPSLSSSPSTPPDVGNSIAPSTEWATRGGKDNKVGKSNKEPSLSSSPSSAPGVENSIAPSAKKATKGDKDSPKQDNRKKKSTETGKKDKQMTSDTVRFFHRGPYEALPVSAEDTDFEDVGTVYLYGGPLYDMDAVEIPLANFTGTCTKTQSKEVEGGSTIRLGGGYCQFTYILQSLEDGTPLVTMDAMGEVMDVTGGVLDITGGTNLLEGVSGEAVIMPLYDDFDETDFFRHAIAYEVDVMLS